MNKVFLCSRNEKQYQDLIKQAQLPNLQLVEKIEEANIILGEPPSISGIISQAKNLQWIQSTFAGCDALLALDKKDYQLTNIRGIFGPLMSEYVFGHIIAIKRHFAHYQQMQAKQTWDRKPYQSIAGLKMTIIGTGSIGQHLASTAKHFGLLTQGVSRTGKSVEYFDSVVKSDLLPQALASADIVVSVLPSTPQTTGLLNKSMLSHCNNAILFNVGRGSVLIEDDLLWAIENKHIQHAVLDVFNHEPLDKNHAFWTHPKITVTPHVSADSIAGSVFSIFEKNYLRWIEKQPLNFQVDFEKGY